MRPHALRLSAFGSFPGLKSFSSSDSSLILSEVTALLLIFLPVTALFCTWALPTLFFGSLVAAA